MKIVNERERGSTMIKSVRTRPEHVGVLAKVMRASDQAIIRSCGITPIYALQKSVERSHFCRTGIIRGRPEAMWGLSAMKDADGEPFDHVWLVLSERLARFPLAIAKAARGQLSELARIHGTLTTSVLPNDEIGLRFAIYLGFRDRYDGAIIPRKALTTSVKNNAGNRVPVGDGYAMLLAYMEGN